MDMAFTTIAGTPAKHTHQPWAVRDALARQSLWKSVYSLPPPKATANLASARAESDDWKGASMDDYALARMGQMLIGHKFWFELV